MMSVERALEKILKEQGFLKREEALPPAEAEIAKELPMDSLDLVDVLCAIEDQFDIQILDGDVKPIKTVGQLIDIIKRKIEEC